MNAQNIITDKQSQSYHILPVMNKNFPKISLLAFGILGQMINIPELDYCTIDNLYNNNRLNSIAELTDAVEELIATHCIIKTSDNRLAVDKKIVANMEIIK